MCLGGGDNSAQREAAERERRQAERSAANEQLSRERDKSDTLRRRRREGVSTAVSSMSIFNSGAQDTAMRSLFSRTGA